MARNRKQRRERGSSRKTALATVDAEREPAQTGTDGDLVERPLRVAHLPPAGATRHAARRYLVWAVAAIALLVLLAPVLSWFRYHSENVISTNATVRAHLAEIGTRVSGLVKAVEVDEGDRVAAGQVLVRLEDGHLRAEVQEARAELRGLRQKLAVERLDIVHQRQEARQQELEAEAKVAAADAKRSAAEIRAEEARRVHEVQESLFARGGAISGEIVRNAESAQRTAEALVEEADANFVAIRSASETARLTSEALAIREQRIGVIEADVLRAEARMLRAEAELESAAIRAPEEGAIVRRFVQPGGSVEVGQAIIAMWLGREVWVEAWIDEDDIGSVRIGSDATVTLQAFPDREFPGVVDKIGLVTDFELPDAEVPQPRDSRMRGAPVVGVRIRLLEPTGELLPGLSAAVAIRRPQA